MTVSTEVDHNDYTGNGVTTSFPYTFRIFKKSDLTVQVADLNENITVLTLDTDYSVTGAGNYSGGNVVLMSPLANGWQISISRDLPVTQETDLRNQGKFFAEVHEDAFDKLTMLIQQCFSFLRLALRKPSFIANYYDALNNRIRNLRDPSQAQDAATKNYTDQKYESSISHSDTLFERTVRIPESRISTLPGVEIRKNKLIAFNDQGDPIVVLPESGSASDVLIQLASGSGLLYIGSTPTISTLQTIVPNIIGTRVQVKEFDYGYIVGGGTFIVQDAANFIADGGKVVTSGNSGLVFVRDEYYSSRIVRPEWYGCRGLGSSHPDTVPFAKMLSSLSDGDYVELRANAKYYNDFPANSQATNGWVITASNITMHGEDSTLSRATPLSASYSGFTTLKVTGNEFTLDGKLLITSDDPTNRPLYAYQSATKIDSREIFTSPLANTLSFWASGVDGLYIGSSVTLSNSVFPFFANNGCKNMKIFCTAKKSGQIYPQPTSASSDLALGSTFKLDACSDFIMDVIANDSAYAGIESESNNVNGSVTLVTNKAYHAGLHLWNRCKNITYKVSATDIVEGGGVITGYGCEACSGYVTAYNAQYIVAYIGNSATTPVISCDAKGSGFNVTDGVVFFATAANNAYIQHCNVDVTVVHADVFSIGTGRQSAVKFNGGQYCDIKVNAKDFDYIFSLGMGANNKFNVAYNKFNTAFSYSDQRSFDNEYKYTDPGGNVYHLQAKASSHEYRSDAVTNPVLGFKPLLRKQINSDGFVNANLPITTTSVGGFYYDPDTKYVRVNL
ncbi:phage tail fiber protein [Klebsiella pneumoniae]